MLELETSAATQVPAHKVATRGFRDCLDGAAQNAKEVGATVVLFIQNAGCRSDPNTPCVNFAGTKTTPKGVGRKLTGY